MSSEKFTNAIKRTPQACPPVWFMRQAGRYHKHYQNLRAKNSFMDLCKHPELAAEVALGPIQDFDFDVAILFSDLLFPLEAMGMGLEYTDDGPKLGWKLNGGNIEKLETSAAVEKLHFQKEAVKLTRAALAANKSLIGFVGGPWTLFSYAVQGSHEGGLLETKKHIDVFGKFCRKLLPVLSRNIELQLEGGAEVVMIFDTAAGELAPGLFHLFVAPELVNLMEKFPGKLGYYSKGTTQAHLAHPAFTSHSHWAGIGVDHRWDMKDALKLSKQGFCQGNFDQALLFSEPIVFRQRLKEYFQHMKAMPVDARAGWVCGLGHGVLPKTPEDNVRYFVEALREAFA